MARVIIPGNGIPNIDILQLQMEQMTQWRKTLEEQRKRELEKYRLRAESIGITVEELDNLAWSAGMSIESYLSLLESLLEPKPTLSSLADLVEVFEEEDCGLSAADIRKQLKYEKNPMRIKQLNKMLYGVSKKVRKRDKEG